MTIMRSNCLCGNPHVHVHMLSDDMRDNVKHFDVLPLALQIEETAGAEE